MYLYIYMSICASVRPFVHPCMCVLCVYFVFTLCMYLGVTMMYALFVSYLCILCMVGVLLYVYICVCLLYISICLFILQCMYFVFILCICDRCVYRHILIYRYYIYHICLYFISLCQSVVHACMPASIHSSVPPSLSLSVHARFVCILCMYSVYVSTY